MHIIYTSYHKNFQILSDFNPIFVPTKTICIALLATFGLYSCDDEKSISFDKLPQAAQQFVLQNFPTTSVVRVIREKDDGRKDYEVTLNNGTQIDFDESGAWTHLESHFNPLPLTFLPQALQTDLAQRYPTNTIHEIDLQLGGYELDLNDGRTVYYTSAGAFVREETPNIYS